MGHEINPKMNEIFSLTLNKIRLGKEIQLLKYLLNLFLYLYIMLSKLEPNKYPLFYNYRKGGM